MKGIKRKPKLRNQIHLFGVLRKFSIQDFSKNRMQFSEKRSGIYIFLLRHPSQKVFVWTYLLFYKIEMEIHMSKNISKNLNNNWKKFNRLLTVEE